MPPSHSKPTITRKTFIISGHRANHCSEWSGNEPGGGGGGGGGGTLDDGLGMSRGGGGGAGGAPLRMV